jgi:hypothetical protein
MAVNDVVRKAPNDNATKRDAAPLFQDLKRIGRLAQFGEGPFDGFSEACCDTRSGIA